MEFWLLGKPDPDTEVRRLLLSYMNGIQAIYLLPSLQQEIQISIVRMEMWKQYDPYNNYQVFATLLQRKYGIWNLRSLQVKV